MGITAYKRRDLGNGVTVNFPASLTDDQIDRIVSEQRDQLISQAMSAKRVAENAQGGRPKIDTETGAPALQRAGLSIKTTPEGRRNFLTSIYGPGNVGRNAYGDEFVRRGPQNEWLQVDPSGLEVGDIADLAGPAISTVPPVVTGLATANPVAVGLAAAGGEGIRKLAARALPGEEGQTALQAAGDVAISGATSGLLQGGANALLNTGFWGANKIAPGNVVARQLNSEASKGNLSAANALEDSLKQYGTTQDDLLTLGEKTQGRGILMAENMARQSVASADDVHKFDLARLGEAKKRFNNFLDSISQSTQTTRADIGQKMASAYDDVASKAWKARSSMARTMFGDVDALAGDRPIISANNVVRVIDEEIAAMREAQQFGIKGAADAQLEVFDALKKSLLSRAENVAGEGAATLTAGQWQKASEYWGRAAGGRIPLSDNVDKAWQTRVAKRIFGALQADLDDAASVSPGAMATPSDIAKVQAIEALKKARAAYKTASQELTDLGDSMLARASESGTKAPENIVDDLFRTTTRGSQIKTTLETLRRAEGGSELADEVAREMARRVFTDAVPDAATRATISWSPAKVATNITKHREQLAAALTTDQMQWIIRFGKAMERISDKAGMVGSQTGRFQNFMQVASDVRGLVISPLDASIRLYGGVIVPKKIAEAMTDPIARQAIMTVVNVKAPTSLKGATAALAYLSRQGIIEPETAVGGLVAVDASTQPQ